MKKHLGLTCLAYFVMGFGFAVSTFATKSPKDMMGVYYIPIFPTAILFFAVIVFTSMEKVKRKLNNKPELAAEDSCNKNANGIINPGA